MNLAQTRNREVSLGTPLALGEVLALRVHCVHTAHAKAEMGRVRFPKVQSNLWCDLLTVQWPK